MLMNIHKFENAGVGGAYGKFFISFKTYYFLYETKAAKKLSCRGNLHPNF